MVQREGNGERFCEEEGWGKRGGEGRSKDGKEEGVGGSGKRWEIVKRMEGRKKVDEVRRKIRR